ncbi:hypothetical protein ACTXT7_013117 [Hymenolepis weldensis]
MLPSFDIAIEKITQMPAFRGVYFHVVPIIYFDWLACDTLAVLEKFANREVNVLVGPLNDFALASVARLSSAFYQTPILTPCASSVALSEKNEFALLTRTYYTQTDLTSVLQGIFNHFKWLPNNNTPVGALIMKPKTVTSGFNSGWDEYFANQALESFMKNYYYHKYQIDDIKEGLVTLQKYQNLARGFGAAIVQAVAQGIEIDAHRCKSSDVVVNRIG